MKRAFVLFGLLAILCVSMLTVRAQPSEPTVIIDAVLRDLSGKLGTTLTRANVDTYTWEQVKFGDASLGCPQPGVMYPQVVTLGYHIVVTVNGVAYDYRATNDGKQVFECTAQSGGTVVPHPGGAITPNVPSAPGAPATYTNPIAYVGPDGNVYVTQLGGGAGTPITNDAKGPATLNYYPFYQPLHFYSNLRWSSDGSKLAFVDNNARTLYVVLSGQPPQIVARGIEAEYPPFWLAGGQEVGYAIPAGTGNAGGSAANFQIQALAATGGTPRVLGQFNAQTGCGGGGFDPATAAYMAEAGYMGNSQILAATASGGYLYSASCIGIGLSSTSGASSGWQRSDLGRAALSPDGTQLIALRFAPNSSQTGPVGLEKVDLATGQGTPLTVQPGIDQIGWADNNTILYSTVNLPTPITATFSQTVGQQVFGSIWPFQSSQLVKYAVGLWSMPATGGSSTQLTATSGRGIGTIRATPDGANAVFSLVPSLDGMISALNAGQSADAARKAAPFPQIVVVQMNGQQAAQLAKGGQPAPASGTFITVAAAPVAIQSNVPPPALVIGGQAVVTTTAGTSLNLRQNPTTTAPVKRLLPAGTVVTILVGPTIAEGLRWWQVRAPDGAVGWVADQVTDSTGTTNTLTPQ
ncbi:MAG: SH3 domain-containing protein [Aggregatilineales bacterium]